jgi:hypothetical protein
MCRQGQRDVDSSGLGFQFRSAHIKKNPVVRYQMILQTLCLGCGNGPRSEVGRNRGRAIRPSSVRSRLLGSRNVLLRPRSSTNFAIPTVVSRGPSVAIIARGFWFQRSDVLRVCLVTCAKFHQCDQCQKHRRHSAPDARHDRTKASSDNTTDDGP